MSLNVQTKTATTSATKLAVAFAFLGAAALAAAAASMPTGKLAASESGFGYDNPLPVINDQPDIKRFDMQIAPDKAVFVANSFSYQNLSFDPVLNSNTFNKTAAGVKATLQITPSIYEGTSPVSYGFGVVYNQFPAPKFNGEVNPFQIEVLDKGVLTWSNKPRLSLTLDPELSKTGYMTFFVLTKNEDGVHMIPEVAADDITYVIMKNATSNSTSTPVIAPTSTPAAVLIEQAYDATTVDRILTPSVAPVQVGKWRLTAKNGDVSLNKITFQVLDEKNKLVTDSKDFGPFVLYNAKDLSTVLSMGTYVPGIGKGYVQFSGNNIITLVKDQPQYLILRATVNGSGYMKSNSVRTFTLRATTPSSLSFTEQSNGKSLTNSQILLTSSTTTAPGSVPGYGYYLLHNSAPVIAPVNLGYDLGVTSSAPLFKFTVSNPGDREMRLGTIAAKISASGLSGSSANFGHIKNWRLWEANAMGGLGVNLAATSTCQLAGATAAGCVYNSVYQTILLTFDKSTQINNQLSNLSIPAGSSRTFIITADTRNIFTAKTQGTVAVTAVLDGMTGFNRYSAVWSTGPVQYYYTPVGANKEMGPFAQSDSYDVMGNTLTRTL